MRIFIQSQGLDVWEMVENDYVKPTTSSTTWTQEERKAHTLNARAINCLYCALDLNEFNRVSSCESAFQIWKILEVTHEGTTQVKETRSNILPHDVASEASSSSFSDKEEKDKSFNFCLMAIDDEVSSNSSCDDDESSSNDLQEEYNNLFHEFKSLGSKYISLKKEKILLLKEKDELNASCESLKNEKIVLASHVNALSNSLNLLKNEVQNLNLKLKGLKNLSSQMSLKKKSSSHASHGFSHAHAHAHSRDKFASKSHAKLVRSKNFKSHSHNHDKSATHIFNGNCFYCGMHGHRISNCMYRMDSKMGNAFWVPNLSNF